MTSGARFARLPGRSGEEAVRRSREAPAGCGFAVDIDLLAQTGPAIVAALDEQGPVLVLVPLTGAPDRVAAAATRLARFGAAWVVVAATAGETAIRSAVDAVSGTGCGVAAATVPGHADDALVTATMGMTRGKAVARLSRVAVASGASGVIGIPADIGVVAEVAPSLETLIEVADRATAGEALRRGAGALIVPDTAGGAW